MCSKISQNQFNTNYCSTSVFERSHISFVATGGQRGSASSVRPGSEFHESCFSSTEGVHGFAGTNNISTCCLITLCVMNKITFLYHYCYHHRHLYWHHDIFLKKKLSESQVFRIYLSDIWPQLFRWFFQSIRPTFPSPPHSATWSSTILPVYHPLYITGLFVPEKP